MHVDMQGSVGTSLVTAFGGRWLYAGLLHFIFCSFQFAAPLLQREFLKNIPSTQANSRAIGLVWAVVISICSVSATLFRRQVLHPLPTTSHL